MISAKHLKQTATTIRNENKYNHQKTAAIIAAKPPQNQSFVPRFISRLITMPQRGITGCGLSIYLSFALSIYKNQTISLSFYHCHCHPLFGKGYDKGYGTGRPSLSAIQPRMIRYRCQITLTSSISTPTIPIAIATNVNS